VSIFAFSDLLSFFLGEKKPITFLSVLVWTLCCRRDFSGKKYFSSVMMHHYASRKVVAMWEQLIELSKAQVTPGIRPQIQIS